MKEKLLDQTERARQEAEFGLNGGKSAAERNLWGQFATPTPLALEIAELGKEQLLERGAVRFMDPGLGSGVFFYAARKVLGVRLKAAWGYEIDPAVADIARQFWGPFGLDARLGDFCMARPPEADLEKATLVLCNPPYVRHHHLPGEYKAKLRTAAEVAGFHVSGLAGLYCYFILLAHRWMAPGGVGVWIVPAELLDVNYGRAIKEYLTAEVTLLRAHRFDPADVQFTDALVTSVVVIFRKASPRLGHYVKLTTGGHLSAPQSTHILPLAGLNPATKWGPLFSGSSRQARKIGALTVGDLFSVRRGLATGANEYFILPRSRAENLRLPARFLRPILPSPREIPGSVIEGNGDGFPKGLPELVLLDCDLSPEGIRQQFPELYRYLEQGRRRGISQRYLPSHRRLWYSQEERPSAPILCTYMGRQTGGRALRFIRNRSAATAPNVYLLLYPKPALAQLLQTEPDAIDRIFEELTEVATRLTSAGRVYGGGLNKIEPKELEAIELPQTLAEKYGRHLG